MANVISPNPKRAVVSQRSRTLRGNEACVDVSMAHVIPHFGVHGYKKIHFWLPA